MDTKAGRTVVVFHTREMVRKDMMVLSYSPRQLGTKARGFLVNCGYHGENPVKKTKGGRDSSVVRRALLLLQEGLDLLCQHPHQEACNHLHAP